MNKNIKLAVAGAVLALSATAANAGIIIPAGDWTVDLGGNVNAFYTHTQTDTTDNESGVRTSAVDGNTIGTGLLPAAFGIGAKTRQNDLDVAFQFSFFTGTSSGNNVLSTNGLTHVYSQVQQQSGGAAGNNTLNIRQAFLTFGDKSWGSFKLGRDLGIFGSDAILSDMTLLGVGTGGPAGGSSTLGRIGSGYIYADWKGQISYSSPNFNGFQVSGGVMENFKPSYLGATTGTRSDGMGYEAKATYDFAANDVTGRVWVSGVTQKTENSGSSYTSKGGDVGAKVSVGPASLVGYYYSGDGLDSQNALLQGLFNV
jgi:predicted porin